jgi:magnesium transporter
MAATVVVRQLAGGELTVGGMELLAAPASENATVWVDVSQPDADTLHALRDRFGLHPLAIEDCLHFPQRVKVDLYPESLFMVWAFADHVGIGRQSIECDIFLGKGFLITSHREPIVPIEQVGADAQCALESGADWTLHALLDRGVDGLFPEIDSFSERLSNIEDALLADPDENDLQDLYGIKRELIAAYRIVAAERDALRSIARREQLISSDAYMYFQDVGDHLERVVEGIETYREVSSGAVDIYLSAVNNRLNDVMKRLTLVATIFMPLSFITGVFGMNLTRGMWPSPESVWSFAAVNLAMLVIAAVMIAYYRRKRWL